MKHFTQTKTQRLAAVAFWVAVWQLCAKIIGEGVLLPSPVSVLSTLGRLLAEADFYRAAGRSLLAITMGVCVAIFLSVALALLADRARWARILLSPLVVVTRTTPVASFIILLLLWVRSDQITAPIAGMMTAPVVYTALLTGLDAVDRQLLEAAQVLGLSPFAVARKIKLPLALPFLANGIQTAIGLSTKAAVAAEVIAQTGRSLGGRLALAKTYLETEELFATTIVILLLSRVLEQIAMRLCRKLWGGP